MEDSRVGLGKIYDHNSPIYARRRARLKSGQFNGAYYYSIDIVKNIIPNVFTTRNWSTIGIKDEMMDNSICFIHHNVNVWEHYKWLAEYKNVIAVCGREDVTKEISRLATAIYLPLSVDIEDVLKYKSEKTRDVCFVGNMWNSSRDEILANVPHNADFISDLPREETLKEVSKYKICYAIGRCAIEAKVLGCEVRPSVPRVWNKDWETPLDNKEAAKILQQKINEIELKKALEKTSPYNRCKNINVNKHKLEDLFFQ